ncbi:hypothetical protein, partial [Bradyrhizobium sp. 142]|uniref:hypothetical protein n=1 Tax=Bradyrhizobium sp. 142 TaxID=2782618 RepID=UPI001FF71949
MTFQSWRELRTSFFASVAGSAEPRKQDSSRTPPDKQFCCLIRVDSNSSIKAKNRRFNKISAIHENAQIDAAQADELRNTFGFLDAGNKEARHAQLTGVQKAPRHEVAGSWAPIVRRALWGFNVGADVDDVGDVSLMPAGYLRAREIGRVREELRRSLGSDRGAIRTLTDAIGLSEIAAGAGPAYRKQIVASLTGRLAHEVSILF